MDEDRAIDCKSMSVAQVRLSVVIVTCLRAAVKLEQSYRIVQRPSDTVVV